MPNAKTIVSPVLTKTWPATHKADLSWPLQVGFIEPETYKQVGKGYWPSQLCEMSVPDRKPKYFELLIVSYSVKSLISLMQLPLRSKVVIVLLQQSDKRKTSEEIFEKTANQLREKTGASGVLFIIPQNLLVRWFEEFVINLSHNQGVTDAASNAGVSFGRFFVTPHFDNETRLSLFIKKLIDDLKVNKYSSQKKFSARLNTGYKNITLNEAADYLNRNFKTLVYDHESGPASMAKEMVSVMKKSKVTAVPGKNLPSIVKKKTIDIKNPYPRRGESRRFKSAKPINRGGVAAKKAIKKASKKIFKKAARKPVKSKAAKPVTAAKKATRKKTVKPRFLQAAFRKKGNKNFEKNFLLPSTRYQFCIKIGETDLEYIKADYAFPTEELFKDEKIQEVQIDLEVRINTVAKPFHKKLTLPRVGDSNIVTCPVSTGRRTGFLEAEVLACYKNRLLQRGRLKIEIRKEKDKAKLKSATFKLESVLNDQFDNLEERTAFDAVIALPYKPDATKPVAGMTGKKELPFKYTPAMNTVVQKIRNSLERMALTPLKESKLRNDDTIRELRILANQGSLLYNNYLNQMSLNGPMQLVTNNGAYLPIDFAYTRKAPDQQATLCKQAEKALAEGKCANCIKDKKEEYKNICPFGFWALSQVIERHAYKMNANSTESDYVLKSDSGKQRSPLKIFNKVLHGSSSKLNEAKKGLNKKLSDELKKSCTLTLAKDWSQWEKAVPADPDSLVLVVHIENNPETEVDALEIGTELLDQTQLDERYIPSPHGGKAPFVILFGCESTSTDAYLFDTVKQFFNKGAAIVVSNFTKILGDQAAEMLVQLVELLKEKPVKDRRFGEVMLRLKQLLVSRGIVGGLSLLCHGDTDWKISV